MGRTIDKDLKDRIVLLYKADHLTMETIAAQLRVSASLVSKVLCLHRIYGQVTNPFSNHSGRPSYLNNGDLEYMQAILQANSGLYLDEIQDKLKTVRNVYVSILTITRALQSLNLTWKSTTRAAAQRDEELRTLWEADMAQYTDPELFVFLDESAVDQSTAERTHGRSPIGTRCMHRATFVRRIRHSVLPALSCDGIIALDVFEGSVNKERFLQFLQEQVVCISQL